MRSEGGSWPPRFGLRAVGCRCYWGNARQSFFHWSLWPFRLARGQWPPAWPASLLTWIRAGQSGRWHFSAFVRRSNKNDLTDVSTSLEDERLFNNPELVGFDLKLIERFAQNVITILVAC